MGIALGAVLRSSIGPCPLCVPIGVDVFPLLLLPTSLLLMVVSRDTRSHVLLRVLSAYSISELDTDYLF